MIKNLEFIIGKIFYYPIKFFFYVYRFLKDHSFKYSLKSEIIKYNYFSFFSWLLINSFSEFKRIINYNYSNFSISKYFDFNKIHYSTKGRGYFNYQSLNYFQKKKIYFSNISRFEILFNNSNIFRKQFLDKDTFLDLGCGKGENIKYFLKNFPNSKITGLDINNEALEIIREFEKSPNLYLNQVDLSNLNNIKIIKSKSFDNIILSHVLSTLLKEDINQTTKYRDNLINECLRISKKNLIIIDDERMFYGNKSHFLIEQLNRGFYYQNIFNLDSLRDCSKEKFLIKYKYINSLIIRNI